MNHCAVPNGDGAVHPAAIVLVNEPVVVEIEGTVCVPILLCVARRLGIVI